MDVADDASALAAIAIRDKAHEKGVAYVKRASCGRRSVTRLQPRVHRVVENRGYCRVVYEGGDAGRGWAELQGHAGRDFRDDSPRPRGLTRARGSSSRDAGRRR